MKQLILALLVCAAISHAQLQSIYRNTKEVHRGTAAQREAHSCLTGDLWFTTDANAGQNWFGCTGPDTWAQMGGKLPFIDVTAAPYNAKGDGSSIATELNNAIGLLSGSYNVLVIPSGLGPGSATTCPDLVTLWDLRGGTARGCGIEINVQTTGVQSRMRVQQTKTNPDRSTVSIYGVNNVGSTGAAVSGSHIGMAGEAYAVGSLSGITTTGSNLIGGEFSANVNSTGGTLPDVRGSTHVVNFDASSTAVTDLKTVVAQTAAKTSGATSTVANAYGFVGEEQSVGTQRNYSFWSQGHSLFSRGMAIDALDAGGVTHHNIIFGGDTNDTLVFKPLNNTGGISFRNTDGVPALDILNDKVSSSKPIESAGLKSSTLAGTGNRCLETDANGNIVVAGTGAACGSGSGGSGTFQSTITDLKPTNTSTVLTIAAGRCAGTSKSAATATITAGSGNGSYAAYCTDTQAIVVEHSTAAGLTITCSGCTASQVTTPSIPFGMQPIATGSITTGAWGTPADARNGIDLAGHRHQNATGMATVCANGTCLDQVNTATVQMRSDNYTPVSQFDASASTLFRQRELSSDPATCAKGEYYWNTTSTKGRRCTATNTWADDASGGTGSTLMMVSRYAPLAYNTGTVGKNLIDFEYGTSSPSANGQWGTEPAKYGQSFPATGTTQVYYPFQVPANWTGSVIIDAQIWWGQNTTGGASGNYKFDFAVMCQNSNATISTQTYNTASAVTTADQGIHKLQVTSATSITHTGCAAGSFGTLRLRRLGDDAADTGTEAAIVLGLGVTLRNQ